MNENGEVLLMGRSSNSSHYQLAASRLISRVHVKARYIAASQPLEPNKVEIVCNGWNGLKLHCQGRTWELAKGDTFTSETEGAEIMIDVQGARVLVHWPRRERGDALGHLSDSSWDDSPRPKKHATNTGVSASGSPFRRARRIASPESPTPAPVNPTSSHSSLRDLMPDSNDHSASVEIYEDPADEQELPKLPALDLGVSMAATELAESFSSDLSEPHSEDDHNPDEENDPIVHSFGPFGANLSNRLASFTTFSPKIPQAARHPPRDLSSILPGTAIATSKLPSSKFRPGSPLPEAAEIKKPSPLSEAHTATITNHVVNQLAFSRLASNPLSGIMNNLPAEERKDLTTSLLRDIIESTECIGVITRHGKDAAGKALESQYYYVPEKDTDEQRRFAVTDGLRKPSLRACRKQHKVSNSLVWPSPVCAVQFRGPQLTVVQQYYWKRPKTP
jgi:hypothetical protein